MKLKTERTTITNIKIREDELREILISYIKSKGANIDGAIQVRFNTEAFSKQEDGLNAYDEDVANIEITKTVVL